MKNIVLFFLFGAVAALSAQEIPQVRTVTAKPVTSAAVYEIPGRTEPIESATIFTRATGVIRERRFEIGQVAKAGDVLALIDAPEIDRAVDAARANVEQAIARAANAQGLSNRSSRLFRDSAVSEEELQQRQTGAVESEAGVRVARAELARLEEQQRFSTVRAPFDAVISARNLDRGDLTRGDAAPENGWLYRLNRLDTLRFVVSASPDLALRLDANQEGVVRFAEFPGRDFQARVAHTSRLFETSSGTMRVELLLENADLTLPAGLTGQATFQVKPATGAYLVPNNALILRAGKNLVTTIAEGKARLIEVQTGRNLGRDVEVTSSRFTGPFEVILNPNAMLRDGDPVAAAPLTAAK